MPKWIKKKLTIGLEEQRALTPALRPIADLVISKEEKELRHKLGLQVRCRPCGQWF